MGFLTVEGRGGERLVWRFGNGEMWVTNGDDARRADPAASGEPGTDQVSEPSSPAYGQAGEAVTAAAA
jgi:hypothetical protein